MKKISCYFIILLSLAACNSEKAEKTVSPSPEPVSSSAEQLLKVDINKYPDSAILKEKLIQYYRVNGNYDNALQETNKAISKDSNNARLWNIKAILHTENQDTLQAIKAFERSVEILPVPEDVISLATLYAATKNEKALQMADALLLADKSKADKEAFFIKGIYYSAINQKEKAITFFDKCLEINYTFMFAYREKCIALYDLGRYKDAFMVIKKGITLQNGYEEGYYYEGMCLEKMNRIADAIECYQTALMYAPDYLEAKEALGRLGVKS